MKQWWRISLAAAAVVVTATVASAAVSPYTGTEANTLHLWHFDETAGDLPAGNAFNDAVGDVDFTNTGGLTGRDNSSANGNGYGGAAYSGAFGSSFNVLRSGDTTWHGGTSGSGTGGGASASGVAQSSLQGSSGAFTLEAIIYSNVNILTTNAGNERTILSHDGPNGSRGFSFRTISGKLSFYTGGTSPNTFESALPTTGDHAFAVNKWYHVAIAYNGNEGEAGNTSFYWTALDSNAAVANLLGTATLPIDMLTTNNTLAVGSAARSPYRFEWEGLIDEVRISDVARGPGEFMFVPEPASLGLIAMAGTGLLARRRRRAI